MSYPSKYKTSPTATEKVSRTGHDVACMYFGPLGPIDYYKVNAGLTGGVGALVNEPTNPFTNNICLNATESGIKNVLNYYPQKIDGKPTGGGSGAKRWESIANDRLTQNYHRIQAQYVESRYPMYAWYIAAVDRSIEQMDANPDWHYANKLSATEADEIFTRTPAFNIYTNNVFYNCNEGLSVPTPGMSDCIIEGNRDFAAGTDLGFLDAENGDYTLKEDSILFENGNFYAPDFSLMGATYEIHNSK